MHAEILLLQHIYSYMYVCQYGISLYNMMDHALTIYGHVSIMHEFDASHGHVCPWTHSTGTCGNLSLSWQ